MIIISDHAYKRAKERLGLNQKALDRMAEKAFNDGFKHGETKGTLQKYITKLWFDHKNCNNVRIYGENIYFFRENKLVTLYRLHRKLIKFLNY